MHYTRKAKKNDSATSKQMDEITELAYKKGFGSSAMIARMTVVREYLDLKGATRRNTLRYYEAQELIQRLKFK